MSCGCCGHFNFMTALQCCQCQPVPPSTQCDVGYFYNFEVDHKVDIPQNDYVPFNEPPLIRGGITQISPTEIGIASTGIYEVTYYVNGGSQAILGLELNGTVLPQTIYTSATSTATYGQALIEVTTVPSTLRLKVVGSNTISLSAKPPNEPASVNASLVIEKVCNI